MGGFDRAKYLLEHDDAGHDRAAGKVSRQAGMVVWNRKLHGAQSPRWAQSMIGAMADRNLGQRATSRQNAGPSREMRRRKSQRLR